jgi:acyl-CoA synthetase (AMP-forming)/AMP-acid ligase II
MRQSVETLLDLLDLRAHQHGDRAAFVFDDCPCTFREVRDGCNRFATLLGELRVDPGERVVIALPNGPEFFAAFYGTQRAGAIPVPIFPESGLDRMLGIAGLCGAAAIVASKASTLDSLESLRQTRPLLAIGMEQAPGANGFAGPWPSVGAGDPAMIQYTSGSTGASKGVVLTHDNLLTNVEQMISGMEITPEDVFVSWLPVFHDMGLVLMTMAPFYLAAPLFLLPTRLTDARRWLGAIASHRATFTAAPDFAYRLCLRLVRDPGRFDLSSLRVALNAAEPVRAATIRSFERAFGLRNVMVPGYGLAEATVGVSMQPPGTAFEVDARGRVAIGRPFPDIRIHIVAGERLAEPGEIGEIVVESPANTSGYFEDPEATAALRWRDGDIRTGDLGYRDEKGTVFFVGRKKNIIIQAGRNLAPREIEEAVEALPFVRRAAAVGIDRGRAEGEQAYVFVEMRRAAPRPEENLQAMATEVVAALHRSLGMRPGRVYLVKPRSIPLTPNGKIRHAALRDGYLDGSLRSKGSILFPGY